MTYYILPHSHTDAGWWLTFNVYYHARAKNILTTTFSYLWSKYGHSLSQQKDGEPKPGQERMLWADYAFFIKWWNSDTVKETRD